MNGVGGEANVMVSAEFARTASRLREMQSKEYFSRKHASASNPQVLQQTSNAPP
jgi:cell division protein ZapE